jgi:membrane fusion protein (multidrug efflux system)
MKAKRFFIPVLILAILWIVTGCGSNEKEVKAPLPEVKVIKPIQKDIPITKEFVGQIYGIYDIPIRARVEGWLEGIHFKEGGAVSKGQLLYTIDDEQLNTRVAEAMSTVAEARTILANAESELNRIKPLAEINAVSMSDLDAAQAAYDASQANVDAANANLRSAEIHLSYAKMYSPINGIIGKTKAKVGEFVGREPNPVILNTVSRIDTVRVEFFLTESDYLQLAQASLEKIEEIKKMRDEARQRSGGLELILSDGTIHPYKGKMDFVDRQVDPGTGALLIQGSFPNPDKILRPGQFARVKANISNVENALILPQRCFIELQGSFSVLTVDADGKVGQKQVEVGTTWNDYRLVIDGIGSDELVILEGVQQTRPGMVVKPVISEYESRVTN